MDDGGSRPPPALCMYVILLCMYIVLGYLYTKIPASLTNTKALGKDHVRCENQIQKVDFGLWLPKIAIFFQILLVLQ